MGRAGPSRTKPGLLYSRAAKHRSPCPNPPQLTLTTKRPGPLLWRGSRGPDVLRVQQELQVPGANGFFGPQTMRAVAAYQRERDLPATGAVDTVTRTRMVTDGILKR